MPSLHGDPFGRLLVAQSQLEPLTLPTSDSLPGQYGADAVLV